MVESLNASFGPFCFVKMLVNDGCLGLAETDKVDDVREYLNETVMCGSEKIREGEVVNAALQDGYLEPARCPGILWQCSYLNKQLPKRNVKSDQVPRISRDYLHLVPTDIFRSGSHSRLDCLARCIH